MQVFLGLLGIALGIVYIKYNYKITNIVGKFPWAENYIGSGSTYLVHKLIGLALIIISIMWMTGSMQSFLQHNVSNYFSSGR